MNQVRATDKRISPDSECDSSNENTERTILTNPSTNPKPRRCRSCKFGNLSCHKSKHSSFLELTNSSGGNNDEKQSHPLNLISTNQNSSSTKYQPLSPISTNHITASPKSETKGPGSTNSKIPEPKVDKTCESTPLLSQTDPSMDGRGIEIIVSDENDARVSTVHSGNRALFRRVWMVLLDNRVAGRPDSERALRPHPEEYRVLKRVLNIIFVTIGVALLISVFVVIIYTYFVDVDEMRREEDNSRAYLRVRPSIAEETTTTQMNKTSILKPERVPSGS